MVFPQITGVSTIKQKLVLLLEEELVVVEDGVMVILPNLENSSEIILDLIAEDPHPLDHQHPLDLQLQEKDVVLGLETAETIPIGVMNLKITVKDLAMDNGNQINVLTL